MVAPIIVSAMTTAAASIIVDRAKDIILHPIKTIQTATDWKSTSNMNSSLSLTQYTKQVVLRSRVYIDGSLADEPTIPTIVKALHTMYAGLIMTALQMNQLITKGKTVQDFIGAVATEALEEPYHDVRDDFADQMASLEALTPDEARNIFNAAPTDTTYELNDVMDEVDRRRVEAEQNKQKSLRELGREKAPEPEKKPSPYETRGVTEAKLAPPEIASVGKLIDVTITNPDHPGESAKITLMVQMVPYLIPTKLAHLFISKDTRLSFSQRILQWKAGEISFWRDLILNVDQINRSHDIAKQDPSKVFYDFMSNVAKKDRATVSKNLARDDHAKSHNLANSVMIFSKEAVAQAKAETGVDLHDAGARARYFSSTYAMVICVVDREYLQVTMYLNGIDDVGVYPFSAFESKSHDKDGGLDFMKVLSQFTGGKAPRF